MSPIPQTGPPSQEVLVRPSGALHQTSLCGNLQRRLTMTAMHDGDHPVLSCPLLMQVVIIAGTGVEEEECGRVR